MALNRTRRRILIATLVVVGLMGAGTFLYLRRVDSRFVGRWTMSYHPPWPFGDAMRFNSSGTGSVVSSRSYKNEAFLWKVHGDKLTICKYPCARGWPLAQEMLCDAVDRVCGNPPRSKSTTFDIEEVTENSIRLRGPGFLHPTDDFTMTRVTDPAKWPVRNYVRKSDGTLVEVPDE
jgi:hypothetical protein